MTWNSNGTLQGLAITDQSNSANTQTCTYAHDDLARIASVDCVNGSTNLWNQRFTSSGASYDAFGNLMKAVPPGGTGISFLPTYSSTTNRFATLPGCTPSYDADGNLTNDCTHTYTWDAEGKMLTIDGSSVVLTYDALGRMVEQNRGGSYTQIVFGLTGKYALMNGQTLIRSFTPLPGGNTVEYVPGALDRYRHGDWLGSARLTTDWGGNPSGDLAYAPFGEDYANWGTVDRAFTGQSQDTISGMYDFLFREYSPVQGRWLSPDPAGLAAVDVTNPQTWNRYAYLGNSPLDTVDPFGLQGKVCMGECPKMLLPRYRYDCTIDGYIPVDCGFGPYAYYAYLVPIYGACPDREGKHQCIIGFNWPEQPVGTTGANTATITAIHGYEGSKKQFCDQQSNKAFIEAIVPGGSVLLGGDYRPSAVVGATTEVALDRAVDAAAGSSWFLYTVRSLTGLPMTTTAKFLKGFGYVTSAITMYDAVKAMQKEYEACMER